MSKMFQVYGIGQALIPVLPPPLPFENAPTSNQTNYEIGQVVYTPPRSPTAFYFYGGGGNWILISSGSGTIDTLTGNSGTATPSAGNVNVVGTGSITTTGSGSTLTASLTGLTNHNMLVGAGTATIGLVDPGTAGFVLTSNGASADPTFQAVSASGAIMTITGDSGGAESPSAGNFNILGSGSITVAGSANTETVQLTGLTNHNLLIGAGTATITNVAPSATSGVPVISQGASADPTFGTAVVAGGGTGVATMTTAYAPVCAGTTATGPLQVASTGLATAGFVLTSNGSAALPSFQAPPAGGGALVLIDTQTVSSVSDLVFTTGIDNTYNNYLIESFFNGTFDGGGESLLLQISTDGGATYISSNYQLGTTGFRIAFVTGTANVNMNCNIFNITSNSGICSILSTNFDDVSTAGGVRGDTYTGGNVTVNALKILGSAGALLTGTFSLYGYQK